MSSIEHWLRGPLINISPFLQPVAFALIQSQEDVACILADFNRKNLWVKPSGRASVGFHLEHMTGLIGRMMTYADGKNLSEKQLDEISDEGLAFPDIRLENLIADFNQAVDAMINYLKQVNESTLTQPRTVGRKELPSTLIGILFHAGEHVQRHTGQLLVTVSVLNNLKEFNP